MLRITTFTFVLLFAFEGRAMADATVTWAENSPSSPQSGWIQGAGTYAKSVMKKVTGVYVYMYCTNTKTGERFGAQTASGADGVWSALRTGLAAGEYECEVSVFIFFDDFTFEGGKAEKKKITIK
jgi:hypothetical protein